MSKETERESTPSIAEGIRVLVYGSLRKGLGNHFYVAEAEYLGDYIIPASEGYRMVSLGYFPGIIESGPIKATDIVAECYRVSAEQFDALDALEGHPTFYTRVQVESPWKKAWIYTLPEVDYQDSESVPDGDWVAAVNGAASLEA